MEKKIIIPRTLKPGDTIGIAAPADHFDKEKFNGGVDVLKSMGYRVVIPRDVFEKHGRFAGTGSKRATILNRLFDDDRIKAIICARGGYGSMRTLSFLDYMNIQEKPKLLMGFSDISALLVTLYNQCGMVAFHGPNITTLGNSGEKTRNSVMKAFSSGFFGRIISEDGCIVKPGKSSGPLIAGNLTTLCHLTGTPFEPDYHGHILLLEDVGEKTYRIDRMLTHMKLAGCFDGLAGLALGSFEDCGETDRIHALAQDIFSDGEIPILAGFQVGHGKVNLAIPIGIGATMDTERHELSFHGSSA